ncbi:MAG: hypothetical protein LBV50_04140 [Novosphingobium sp.]|nr:hypothetical protein [Novosphingobium sp.]
MKRKPVLAAALFAAMTTALYGAGNASPANPPVTYTRDIAPIFGRTCATCHMMGTEAGRISLVPGRAIASTVNVASAGAPAFKRIVPGKPDQSYLIMKLEGTHIARGGTGARMPFNAPPLPPEKIGLIRRWIADGAKP